MESYFPIAVRVLLLTGVGIYLALIFWMYFRQSELVYRPSRGLAVTPTLLGMDYEDVRLTTSDRVTLHGWWIPRRGAAGTFLFCHGNAANIGDRLETIVAVHEMGLNLFIFDYRGYGLSEGVPDEAGTYRDVEAAWEYLTDRRRLPPERIIIHGRSLGAAIAAHAAKTTNPAGVILESGFTSLTDLGAELYPFFPVRWLGRFHYPLLEFVREIRSPVLILHSRADDLIPFSHAQKIFRAAPEPRTLVELTGGHSNGIVIENKTYTGILKEFAGKVLR